MSKCRNADVLQAVEERGMVQQVTSSHGSPISREHPPTQRVICFRRALYERESIDTAVPIYSGIYSAMVAGGRRDLQSLYAERAAYTSSRHLLLQKTPICYTHRGTWQVICLYKYKYMAKHLYRQRVYSTVYMASPPMC